MTFMNWRDEQPAGNGFRCAKLNYNNAYWGDANCDTAALRVVCKARKY